MNAQPKLSGSSGTARLLMRSGKGSTLSNPAAAEPHQLPTVPQRVLATTAFNECMDQLAWSFRSNAGSITRGRFYQICRSHGVDPFYPQVLLEAARMVVEKVAASRGNSDRFVWRPFND